MSVRVNLLPGEVAARGQANRTRALVAGAFGLLALLLGGLVLLQQGQLGRAEERLAAAQATNTALQADIAALQPFAELEARANDAATLVTGAMAEEVSLAGILQDLSAAMPPGAEFSTVSITASPDPLAPSAGGDRVIWGSMSAAGQVVGLVPGVERLLIDLGRIASFDNVYVPTSTTDENGITTFTLEVELGPEILTERYVIGVEEQG